jgi:hypothetical protein
MGLRSHQKRALSSKGAGRNDAHLLAGVDVISDRVIRDYGDVSTRALPAEGLQTERRDWTVGVLVHQMYEKLFLRSRLVSRGATSHRTITSYCGLRVFHVRLKAGGLFLELTQLMLRGLHALWLVGADDVRSFRIIEPKVAESPALVV